MRKIFKQFKNVKACCKKLKTHFHKNEFQQKKSICFHADKNSSQDYQNWTREERQPKFLPENDIFDEVSFGVEHVTSHPRCPDERHGLRASFIFSNLFGNYSALKFVYYTAYDMREFHLPLYFDLPAEFLMKKDCIAGAIIVPLIGAVAIKDR